MAKESVGAKESRRRIDVSSKPPARLLWGEGMESSWAEVI